MLRAGLVSTRGSYGLHIGIDTCYAHLYITIVGPFTHSMHSHQAGGIPVMPEYGRYRGYGIQLGELPRL